MFDCTMVKIIVCHPNRTGFLRNNEIFLRISINYQETAASPYNFQSLCDLQQHTAYPISGFTAYHFTGTKWIFSERFRGS